MKDIQTLKQYAQELLRQKSFANYRYFYQPRIDGGENGFALYTDETGDDDRVKRSLHLWSPTERQMCETIISRYAPAFEPEVERRRQERGLNKPTGAPVKWPRLRS